MAGSYRHMIDKESGQLITNEDFIGMINNLGDAYEMAEECWHMIDILTDGDEQKKKEVIKEMYIRLNNR